ncbi:MAG TPA: GGDEF domain-containing protein [Ideonella sp.]|nr:GGDEF domain-containing protein [Ideonella sp.]
MTNAITHLGRLTELRDREVVDVSLVRAINELLQPASVAIYRAVGEPEPTAWQTRARLCAGDATPSADPLWADLPDLPAIDERSVRAQCLRAGQAVFAPGPPALSAFPLGSGSINNGVLEVESARPLSREKRALVNGVLHVYRNLQGLLDYSERDTLTGLLNRKSFDAAFYRLQADAREMHRLAPDERRSAGSPSQWLGLIDIDHFKSVNDRFGHLIGDEVLLLVSRLMNNCFRLADRLYRFGGEEFVVLLRSGGEPDAMAAFERFRRTVEEFEMPQAGHITVSVGFTELRSGDTPSATFERADRATYYAKQHGRNQIHSHDALVREGKLQEDSKSGGVELF